jgi:hypothetical protein
MPVAGLVPPNLDTFRPPRVENVRMNYIDLTEAYKNDDWARKVAARWRSSGTGYIAEIVEPSEEIVDPEILDDLDWIVLELEGGGFKFTFYKTMLCLTRTENRALVRSERCRVFIFYKTGIPVKGQEVYSGHEAEIGKKYKGRFLQIWDRLIDCIHQPVAIEIMHECSGYEE